MERLMAARLFTTARVLDLVPGLTKRQIDYWTRLGRLTCERGRLGRGGERLYPLEEVLRARALHRFAEALPGANQDEFAEAARAADFFRLIGEVPWAASPQVAVRVWLEIDPASEADLHRTVDRVFQGLVR